MSIINTTTAFDSICDIESLKLKSTEVAALNGKAKKLIEENGNIKRHILLRSTVKYHIQEYLQTDQGDLILLNKDYKNQKKIDIANCSSNEHLIRSCMLELCDSARVCYILSSDYSEYVTKYIKDHCGRINNKRKKRTHS